MWLGWALKGTGEQVFTLLVDDKAGNPVTIPFKWSGVSLLHSRVKRRL